MKNFFRKVAFGLKPEQEIPSDPLTWAQKQVETIPEFNWKGKYILSEKEMRKYWTTMRVEENTTLRKKYNLSRILQDSDESSDIKEKINSKSKEPSKSNLEYKELRHFDVPLSKDQTINLKDLADRQFQRFDHKTFDLNKDRQDYFAGIVKKAQKILLPLMHLLAILNEI